MPEDNRDPDIHHCERMWPGAVVWIVAMGSIGALAIAYASAVSVPVGVAIAVVGTLAVGAFVVRSAVRVTVADDALHAGRAALEWRFVGRVLPLDGAQARAARGPDGDSTAFLLLRPGVGPGAVVIEVTDPTDPHRTWLIASRDPKRLASAIQQTRGRLAT